MLFIIKFSGWKQERIYLQIARGIKKISVFKEVTGMKKGYKRKLNDATRFSLLCHHNIMHLRAHM